MMNRSTFGPGVVTGFLLTVRLHLDLQRRYDLSLLTFSSSVGLEDLRPFP